MGRIRTVKPELFLHDELFDAEAASGLPIRLSFIGLLTVVDREGRFVWKPRQIKAQVLPYDNCDFASVLDTLHQYGFISRYVVDGKEYGAIDSFLNHQQINVREAASKLPAISHGITVQPVTPLNACIPQNTIVPEKIYNDDTPLNACIPQNESVQCMHRNFRACISQNESVPEISVGKGRKGKGRELERKGTEGVASDDACQAEARPSSVQAAQIIEIFKHWQTVMGHQQARLDSNRKKHIGNALKLGYTVDQLKQAIDGCSRTPHNIGDNDRNERYDGVHIIFKSADQIDRFMRNAEQAASSMSRIGRATQSAADQVMSEMFGAPMQQPQWAEQSDEVVYEY